MDSVSAKAALRKDVLARRSLVTETQRQAFAERLASVGAAFAAEKQASLASVFWSIGDEPPTLPLLQSLARQGIATALPAILGRGKPLALRLWKEGEPLAQGQWGIKEPVAEAEEGFPDLLFVPLVAYDRSGNRLGYGAGYYDRTLARLRSMKPVIAVGIAYAAQEAEGIPIDPTDEKLDFVLNDREWIVCR